MHIANSLSECSYIIALYTVVHVQIAKDMERWAKNVNAAKAAQQQQLQVLIQLERTEAQIKAAMGTPAALLPMSGPEETLGERQALLPTSGSEVMRSGIALSAALEVGISV